MVKLNFIKISQPFEMCFRLMIENAQEGEGNNIKAYKLWMEF